MHSGQQPGQQWSPTRVAGPNQHVAVVEHDSLRIHQQGHAKER